MGRGRLRPSLIDSVPQLLVLGHRHVFANMLQILVINPVDFFWRGVLCLQITNPRVEMFVDATGHGRRQRAAVGFVRVGQCLRLLHLFLVLVLARIRGAVFWVAYGSNSVGGVADFIRASHRQATNIIGKTANASQPWANLRTPTCKRAGLPCLRDRFVILRQRLPKHIGRRSGPGHPVARGR